MTQITSTLRAAVPFLPVAAGLFCIQLDYFSPGPALPTIVGLAALLLVAGVVTLVSRWPIRGARPQPADAATP